MIRLRNPHLFACVAVAILCLQGLVLAQSLGSVAGHVTDEQGAVVSGATVTITNTATNQSRTTTATSDGLWQIKQVPPGTYSLRAEATGFKTIVRSDVVIQVNTPLKLDLKFEVGTVTETVEVTAAGETINHEDASVGNTFGEMQVRQLPIEGRNVVDLLSLQPGVTKTDVGDGHDDQRSGAVNGARGDQSNVTLDGIDVNDQQEGLPFTSVLPVTLDSVQEFRVVTANGNADMGRGAGAEVSLVTKSGGNEFHGSVYEFHRNTVTTANTYFNNLAGVDRPKLLRNVFGFSVGGPFIKNKLFFFVNYEGLRDAREDSSLRIVPSAELREGLVQYKNTSGGVTTLTADQIRQLDPAGIGLSPTALSIFQQYPLPNDDTAGDNLNTKGFRFIAPAGVHNNTYIARVDWTINDNNTVFWRGNLANNNATEAPQFPGGPPRYTNFDNSKGYAVGLTSVISNSWTNVARYGLTRQGTESAGASSSAYFGFRGLDTLAAYTYSSSKIVPTHNIADDVTWTHGNHTVNFGANIRFIRFNSNSFDNSFPYTRSNTSWLAGTGQELVPSDPLPGLASDFEVAYLDAMVASLGLLDYVFVQYSYDKTGAALPVGSPVKRNFAANEFEFYVGDSWRIRPNLTINAGVRYSLYSPPWEVNGLQVTPTIPLGEWSAQRIANAATGVPSSASPAVTFNLAGPANGQPGYYPWDKNNFAPRVSVNWSPDWDSGFLAKLTGGPGQTSIRGGFGVFYEHIGAGLANTFDRDGSVGLATGLENPSGAYSVSESPRYTQDLALPPLPPPPPGGFPSTLAPDSFAITFGLDNNIVTPIDYTFDFSISREIPGNMVLEAAYVGRIAHNRLAQSDLAQPTDFTDPQSGQTWYQVAHIMEGWLAQSKGLNQIPNLPYFENLYPGLALLQPGRSATQEAYHIASVLAPDWTTVQYYLDLVHPSRFGPYLYYNNQYSALSAWRSNENTNYNALQIMLRKRMGHGVQFDFNYTWSKSIDLTSEGERTGQYGSDYNTTGFIINEFDIKQNRSVSDFDTTHAVNANWLWELPFGKNQPYLNDEKGWINQLVAGWQVTGIFRATSGFPVSVGNGRIWPTNWNITGWATATGDIKGDTTRRPDGPNLFPDKELALASFKNTSAGYSGDRNILRGDGYFTLDFGVDKTWNLPWEGQSIQFRWEVFNATNTARFDVSSISLDLTNSGTFGRYQDTLAPPRIMQFGLRYQF
ncbi:MAG TPA: carboxypeptidase regulatory-like domain-containing protein [Blastocatellia bacterium]|nr:carboxypeptidase regulatory-like domain-containing protein [Blastocatellia bacterium]